MPKGTKIAWTPDREDQLRILLADLHTVQEISEILEISPNSIYKKMGELGLDKPGKETPSVILEKARKLLRQSNMRIKDVAAEIAVSQINFSTMYRRYFGILPSQEKEPEGKRYPAVDAARLDIERNFKKAGYKAPDLTTIAGRFKIASNSLTRQFKDRVGITMTAFTTQRKLDEAKRLLVQSPSTTLRSISELCGYSPTALSNAFRNHHDMTPEEFRKVEIIRILKILDDISPEQHAWDIDTEQLQALVRKHGFQNIREMDEFLTLHAPNHARLKQYADENDLGI